MRLSAHWLTDPDYYEKYINACFSLIKERPPEPLSAESVAPDIAPGYRSRVIAEAAARGVAFPFVCSASIGFPQ
jgi:hypothetical protein